MSELKFRPPKKLLIVPQLLRFAAAERNQDPPLKTARVGATAKSKAAKQMQIPHFVRDDRCGFFANIEESD
jgi:hypothetical protein